MISITNTMIVHDCSGFTYVVDHKKQQGNMTVQSAWPNDDDNDHRSPRPLRFSVCPSQTHKGNHGRGSRGCQLQLLLVEEGEHDSDDGRVWNRSIK